jgi:hypothetical protein
VRARRRNSQGIRGSRHRSAPRSRFSKTTSAGFRSWRAHGRATESPFVVSASLSRPRSSAELANPVQDSARAEQHNRNFAFAPGLVLVVLGPQPPASESSLTRALKLDAAPLRILIPSRRSSECTSEMYRVLVLTSPSRTAARLERVSVPSRSDARADTLLGGRPPPMSAYLAGPHLGLNANGVSAGPYQRLYLCPIQRGLVASISPASRRQSPGKLRVWLSADHIRRAAHTDAPRPLK